MADPAKPEHVEMELRNSAKNMPKYGGSMNGTPESSISSPRSEDGRPLVKQEMIENDAMETDKEEKQSLSSIPVASFNVVNSIIGSGIVALPFALNEGGLGLGLILIVATGIMTDYSLQLLIAAGMMSNTDSYQSLVQFAFNKPGYYILTILQFIFPLIAMISYNIVAGDTIRKIVLRAGSESIRNSIFANRQFLLLLFTLVVSLPLSCYRNISKLGKFSAFSIFTILFVTIFVIIKFGTLGPDVPKLDGTYSFADTGAVQATLVMTHAYICHHNAFLMFRSMKEPSQKNWNTVVHISVFFSMLCMALFALFGYLTFGSYTQGDLLENYCFKDDYANVARVVYTFVVMLTYPIECFVTREVIENQFFTDPKWQPQTLLRHMGVTICIVILTGVISMVVDCLGIVLEINGAIGATPLCFIFPACCYLKVQYDNGHRLLQLKNIPAILIAVFGILLCVTGIVMCIIEIANGNAFNCSHGSEMPYCLATLSNMTTNATVMPVIVMTTVPPS